MAERCDKQIEAVRKRVRELATEALKRGRPTGWFEPLYHEAAGDASKVPWADQAPNAALAGWALSPKALAGVRSAVVIGCGLGDDAEFLAARGIETVAFDVSPTAIEWAKRAHPASKVRYEVQDLFALPESWRGRFGLAVEVYTLQALPGAARPAAAAVIASLLAPGGRVFLFTRLRDDGPAAPPLDELAIGPPWPLGRGEVSRLFAGLSVAEPLVESRDPDDPSIVRAFGVWRSPS